MVGGYKTTRAKVSKNSKKSFKRFRKGSAKKDTRLTKGQYNAVNKMINKKIYSPKYVEYKTSSLNFKSADYSNGSGFRITPEFLGDDNKRILIKSIQIKGWLSIAQNQRNPTVNRAFMSLCTYISKRGLSNGIKDFYTNPPESLDGATSAMKLYFKGVRDKFSYKNYKYIKGLNMRRSIKDVSNMGVASGTTYEYGENQFKVSLYKKVNIPFYMNRSAEGEEADLERQNDIYLYIFESAPGVYNYDWDLDITVKYIDL